MPSYDLDIQVEPGAVYKFTITQRGATKVIFRELADVEEFVENWQCKDSNDKEDLVQFIEQLSRQHCSRRKPEFRRFF